MAYQKREPKPLEPGQGKLWKNQYKTNAPDHGTKPDFTGQVICPGEDAERKVSMWVNKYDDGNTNIGVRIGDVKEQKGASSGAAPSNQTDTDDDLLF